MQVPSNISASSMAGVPHAANRGGALQTDRRRLADAQSVTSNPAGKTAGNGAVDAGDQAGDRRGDGHQGYDTFQRSDEAQQSSVVEQRMPAKPERKSNGVDYQA